MFQTLSSRFQDLFRRLRGEGKLSEARIEAGIRDMRRALLEADVHLRVVRRFLAAVRERARDERLTESWTPGRKWTAVVREELIRILSVGRQELELPTGGAAAILLVGLQGSGKTATAAKLGRLLRRQGRSPLLVPADTRRPAARLQLARLAGRAGVDCFAPPEGAAAAGPVAICRAAMAAAGAGRIVVVDTAGRLHVDSDLMRELGEIRRQVDPCEVLFVADAMTGQDAIRSASAFHQAVGLTGVVLSKLDGDARGGAALSIQSETGVPIKLCGTGEGDDDLERFVPDRIAARILGLGDLEGFLEKVETSLGDGEEEGEEPATPTADALDLDQVRRQLRRLRRAGPLQKLFELLPGGTAGADLAGSADQLRETLAILDSMTPGERSRPGILNGSRRRRVARGAGVRVEEVNRFLKQYGRLRRWMPALAAGKVPVPGRKSGRGFR